MKKKENSRAAARRVMLEQVYKGTAAGSLAFLLCMLYTMRGLNLFHARLFLEIGFALSLLFIAVGVLRGASCRSRVLRLIQSRELKGRVPFDEVHFTEAAEGFYVGGPWLMVLAKNRWDVFYCMDLVSIKPLKNAITLEERNGQHILLPAKHAEELSEKLVEWLKEAPNEKSGFVCGACGAPLLVKDQVCRYCGTPVKQLKTAVDEKKKTSPLFWIAMGVVIALCIVLAVILLV